MMVLPFGAAPEPTEEEMEVQLQQDSHKLLSYQGTKPFSELFDTTLSRCPSELCASLVSFLSPHHDVGVTDPLLRVLLRDEQ